MTTSQQHNVAVQVNDEQTQQQFQQLNLQEIGLQADDFQEVLAARKELSDIAIIRLQNMAKISPLKRQVIPMSF